MFQLHVWNLHQDWLPMSVIGNVKLVPYVAQMGQAFTYWRPGLEVTPDGGFRREAETSIISMFNFGYIRVI